MEVVFEPCLHMIDVRLTSDIKSHAYGMEARSGQNHDNKIALQVNFNPTAANIMDMLCIFVITKQYFFQRVSNYF